MKRSGKGLVSVCCVQYPCYSVVAVSHNAACSVTDLAGGEEGYIASVMASYTACGSQHMPWIIQV